MKKAEPKRDERAEVSETRKTIVEAARKLTPEQRKLFIALLEGIVGKSASDLTIK